MWIKQKSFSVIHTSLWSTETSGGKKDLPGYLGKQTLGWSLKLTITMLYWDVQNQGNESEGKVKWSMEEWEADSKWYFFSWTYFKDTGIHSSKDRLHRNAKPRILCLGEEWRGNFSPAFLLCPVFISQSSFHEELNALHF